METIPQESKEKLEYRLSVIVHRHGPKQGVDGPLSEEGKESARKLYEDASEGVARDLDAGVEIEYSPIHRTQETAAIYKEGITQSDDVQIKSEKIDQRLSEGGIAENKEVLQKLLDEYGKGGKWIEGWLKMEYRPTPEIKTGKEAAAEFASWILDKVKNAQQNGGNQQVEAFSHGPVMASFLLLLQEKLGVKILPENWQEQKIFEGVLTYLSSMHIWSDSNKPEVINIAFSGDAVDEVPIETLEELIKENSPYMGEVLRDVGDKNIQSWLSGENLENKNKRTFEGFEITDSIDGGQIQNREVSLVKIEASGIYPPHVHKESDAYFIIVNGEGVLLKDKDEISVKPGDRIQIPRGVAHGFKLAEGQKLEFISIQYPPIRNANTGEEDFHLFEQI